ncbi:MAG: hypothetical protein JSR33_12670 [Proteobacteria bacterium]|nr:hypothetical protein [Pseudomonadota bacterium]
MKSYTFVLEKHRFSPWSSHYFDSQELKHLRSSVKFKNRQEESPWSPFSPGSDYQQALANGRVRSNRQSFPDYAWNPQSDVDDPYALDDNLKVGLQSWSAPSYSFEERTGEITVSNVRSSTKYPDRFLIKVDASPSEMESKYVLKALQNALNDASGYYQIVAQGDGFGYLQSIGWPLLKEQFEARHFNQEIKMPAPDNPLQFPRQFNDDHLIQLSADFLKIQPEYKGEIKWVAPKEPPKKGKFKDHQIRCFNLPDGSEDSKKFSETFNLFLNSKKYDTRILNTRQTKKPSVTVDLTASQEKNRPPPIDEIKKVDTNQIILDFIVPEEQRKPKQVEISPLAQSLAKDIALGLDMVSEIEVTYVRRLINIIAFQITFSGITSRINQDQLSQKIQEFIASGSPLFKLKGIGINLAPKYPSYGGLFSCNIEKIQWERNAFGEAKKVKFSFTKGLHT